MIIAIPYFGNLDKFRPLLEAWFASYRAAKIDHDIKNVVLLSDSIRIEKVATEFGCSACVLKLEGWEDLMRPGHAFDIKGALVCSYLLAHAYPTLVLDADAFIVRDPKVILELHKNSPISMPQDHGALIHYRTPNLNKPYGYVQKRCAGVQWFGYTGASRARLVAGYRRAWEELSCFDPVPWTPPLTHLLEQYAWSLCSHRRGGRLFPVTMNWAPDHLGLNPDAIINHHFGFTKWGEDSAATAAARPPA